MRKSRTIFCGLLLTGVAVFAWMMATSRPHMEEVADIRAEVIPDVVQAPAMTDQHASPDATAYPSLDLSRVHPEHLALFEALMQEGGDQDGVARLEAARRLPHDLPAYECRLLHAFCSRISHLTGMESQHRALLAELIFQNIRRQAHTTDAIADTLAAVFLDESQLPLIRDYAVQHLGLWQSEHPHNPRVEALLWQAAGIGQRSLAGSSLLALHRLEQEGLPIDGARIADTAVDFLTNPESHIANRMEALSVLADRHDPRGVALAREHLHAPSVSLRLAAIAALGTLGDQSDIERLDRWQEADEGRYQRALHRAIQFIQQRMQPART